MAISLDVLKSVDELVEGEQAFPGTEYVYYVRPISGSQLDPSPVKYAVREGETIMAVLESGTKRPISNHGGWVLIPKLHRLGEPKPKKGRGRPNTKLENLRDLLRRLGHRAGEMRVSRAAKDEAVALAKVAADCLGRPPTAAELAHLSEW